MYHKLPHYEILGQNLSWTPFSIPIWSFLDKTDYTQMNITSGKIWPQCIFIFCPATRKNEARQPRRPTHYTATILLGLLEKINPHLSMLYVYCVLHNQKSTY